MTDPHPFDDETTINRIWNEIVGGETLGTTSADVTTERLRRLHALGAAPPPASSRERVRRGLRAALQAPIGYRDSTVDEDALPRRTSPNGHTSAEALGGPRPMADGRRIWWGRRSDLPAAALLLAILGALALGAIVATRDTSDPLDQPVIVAPGTPPAATPSQAATPEGTLLLDILLPAEAIPPSDGRIAGLSYDVIPTGATSEFRWFTETYGLGPFVQHVVSGSFMVTVGGPAQVVRAGGSTYVEDVPADTEVTLSPGDTLLFRNEYPVTTTNVGPEPAEVLDWLLLTDDPTLRFAGRQGEGWEFNDLNTTADVPVIAGGVRLQMRRVALTPDEHVPVIDGQLTLAVTADPEVDIVERIEDETIRPIESNGAVTVVYVVTMIPISA